MAVSVVSTSVPCIRLTFCYGSTCLTKLGISTCLRFVGRVRSSDLLLRVDLRHQALDSHAVWSQVQTHPGFTRS